MLGAGCEEVGVARTGGTYTAVDVCFADTGWVGFALIGGVAVQAVGTNGTC